MDPEKRLRETETWKAQGRRRREGNRSGEADRRQEIVKANREWGAEHPGKSGLGVTASQPDRDSQALRLPPTHRQPSEAAPCSPSEARWVLGPRTPRLQPGGLSVCSSVVCLPKQACVSLGWPHRQPGPFAQVCLRLGSLGEVGAQV